MATYMTAPELAEEWGVKLNSVYALAGASKDPLPIHYVMGKTRNGFVIVDELNEWIGRNTVLYSERKANAY